MQATTSQFDFVIESVPDGIQKGDIRCFSKLLKVKSLSKTVSLQLAEARLSISLFKVALRDWESSFSDKNLLKIIMNNHSLLIAFTVTT